MGSNVITWRCHRDNKKARWANCVNMAIKDHDGGVLSGVKVDQNSPSVHCPTGLGSLRGSNVMIDSIDDRR